MKYYIVIQTDAKKKELDLLAEELIKRSEECSGQKEEITGLLAQVVELQRRLKIVSYLISLSAGVYTCMKADD